MFSSHPKYATLGRFSAFFTFYMASYGIMPPPLF